MWVFPISGVYRCERVKSFDSFRCALNFFTSHVYTFYFLSFFSSYGFNILLTYFHGGGLSVWVVFVSPRPLYLKKKCNLLLVTQPSYLLHCKSFMLFL